MWRSFFALGGMSCLFVALAMHLPPLPLEGANDADVMRLPSAGVYRMDGEVVMNSCPFEPAPLSRYWTVDNDKLEIGGRKLTGRGLKTGMLYESVRRSDDGCLEAVWEVKLTPMGKGLRGVVIWEIWEPAPGLCKTDMRRPCMMKFAVQGLPSTFKPVGG